MVAGPEKEILQGREFAKGDIWSKMRARQAGHLKGIHRSREEGMSVRQTGVIQVKKHRRFWKSRWRPVHGRGEVVCALGNKDDRASKRDEKKRK
jgi:hypothetical protein